MRKDIRGTKRRKKTIRGRLSEIVLKKYGLVAERKGMRKARRKGWLSTPARATQLMRSKRVEKQRELRKQLKQKVIAKTREEFLTFIVLKFLHVQCRRVQIYFYGGLFYSRYNRRKLKLHLLSQFRRHRIKVTKIFDYSPIAYNGAKRVLKRRRKRRDRVS